MSNLEQLKLSFDPVQDRLVLIFFTKDFSEFRFWITRRLVRKLWNALQQLQNTLHKSGIEQEHEVEKAKQHVQQEQVQKEASKYGMQVSRNPLGTDPLLLMQVKIGTNDQGQIHFTFESTAGTNVDFTTDKTFVSLLSQLIQKAIPHTEWDITLQ
ncbi:MAG: hypothetical protein WC222_01820 [Parachlamydiales bacterium]|jgi:hypothetical protein